MRVGDHTDWVMLDVREIACSGVSLPYLSGHDMLHADSVSVGSVEIDSYKDRNQLQSPAFRQMLYTSVQRIPVGIDFPVIDARGINIRYEEVSKLRIGHGFYERDPQKSFWNYLWKTSFAGVTDIVM